MRLRVAEDGPSPFSRYELERQAELALGRYRSLIEELVLRIASQRCRVTVRLRGHSPVTLEVCENSTREAVRQALARAAREVRRRVSFDDALRAAPAPAARGRA